MSAQVQLTPKYWRHTPSQNCNDSIVKPTMCLNNYHLKQIDSKIIMFHWKMLVSLKQLWFFNEQIMLCHKKYNFPLLKHKCSFKIQMLNWKANLFENMHFVQWRDLFFQWTIIMFLRTIIAFHEKPKFSMKNFDFSWKQIQWRWMNFLSRFSKLSLSEEIVGFTFERWLCWCWWVWCWYWSWWWCWWWWSWWSKVRTTIR